MTTPKIDLEGPMMLLDLGWGSKFIVPWSDGVQILNLMKQARFVKHEWDIATNRNVWKSHGDGSVTAASFSPEAQAELFMSGGVE